MATSLNDKLIDIQQKLNTSKNQRNNFGNYNYISCRDMLEVVKILLNENKYTLKINDEVI